MLGNKCDLEKQRSVTNDEAEKYATSVGARHMLVSAKLNKNISELFLYIAQSIKLLLCRSQLIRNVGNTHQERRRRHQEKHCGTI